MQTYDAIIIGTGQAGPHTARRLIASGLRVAVVERKLFGGTCVNTGCIPTKTMIASAHAAHVARTAGEFGVTVGGDVTIDFARVMARKNEISGKSRTGLQRNLEELEGCTVYEGHARFESPHVVAITPSAAPGVPADAPAAEPIRITAERIFLNVGCRAFIPPDMPGVDEVEYLTNVGMMQLEALPEHLIIVGGSYVGLEFGQMFRRFGCEVTIVEMGDRLISREDPEISDAIKAILEREGIHVRTGAKCIALSTRGGKVVVGVDCTSGEPEVTGSQVLLAVGRRPNTDDLGLDKAGVAVDRRGYVTVDDELRTNVPGIWALGDCNGRGAFTHTSWNDAEIVTANLLDHDPRRVSDRITAYALYIDPPLGRVGMTEAEARKTGRPLLLATRPMSRITRAIIKGETQGFMKAVIDAETKQILGAAVLGPEGDEIVQSILDVMYAKAPYTVIQRAVHIHPTVTELIPTMLGELTPLT